MTTPLTKCDRHGLVVCSRCVKVSDAARRMSDTVNEILTFHQPWALRTKWLAFSLAEGRSDKVVYDTKADAIKHQLHEEWCCYFPIGKALGGTTPKDCQLFLEMYRHAYDQGFRFSDAEAPEIITPTAWYDQHVTGKGRHVVQPDPRSNTAWS